MIRKPGSKLNRREALLGGIAATAAVGLGRAAEAEATAESWSHEADVVVVGSGAAGCSAAIAAVDAGASVIVLEREALLGGTTGKSGAVMWIADNPLMREKGIVDPREDCLKYMARYAYPQYFDASSPTLGIGEHNLSLLQAFYDNGKLAIDKIRSLGAVKIKPWVLWGSEHAAPDYFDHEPHNKVPAGRCLEPVGGASATGGALMIDSFEQWLKAHGVKLLTEHRVTRLIMDKGRAIGVEVDNGKQIRVRARRGVVFASGGYAHNTELIGLHQKAIYGACARRGSQGDFITIGAAAGVKMGPLDTAWRTQVLLEEALDNRAIGLGVFYPPGDSMIQVNKYGRRVVDEKRCYNDRTKVHFTYDPVHEEYANQVLVMVFDARTLDAYGGNFPLPLDVRESRYLIKGRDVAELTANIAARLARIEGHTGGTRLAEDFATQLAASIERFNVSARSGVDAEFGRGGQAYDREWQLLFSMFREGSQQPRSTLPNITMHPFENPGPLYAFLLGAGALDTNGGPMINAQAQVLDPWMKPIPGLWGAGNCIASPTREAYLGAGCTIGLAVTFGHIAGRGAAAAKA